jgi:hypothetical protein
MRLLPALSLGATLLLGVSQASAADTKYVTIKGQVTYTKAPEPAIEKVDTDKPVCCKNGDLKSNKYIVDAKTKGLQNAVVWLRPDSDDRAAPFPQDKIEPTLLKAKPVTHTIDQPKCQFEPRIVAAREGDNLLIKNTAAISHNFSINGNGQSYNPSIPAGKEYKAEEPLKADRLPTPFSCGSHTWMQGRIRVFDHPYFAVTDEKGNFEIKNAPEGKFRIVYWHEAGFHKGKEGVNGFEIEIKDGGKATMELKPIDIELPASK